MFPIYFSSPYSRNIFIRLTCKNHIEYSIVFFGNFFVFLGHRSSVTDDSLICFCLDHQEINWNWLSRSFRVLCWARNGIKFSWKICQFTSIFRNSPSKLTKKSIFNKVISYSCFWHKKAWKTPISYKAFKSVRQYQFDNISRNTQMHRSNDFLPNLLCF